MRRMKTAKMHFFGAVERHRMTDRQRNEDTEEELGIIVFISVIKLIKITVWENLERFPGNRIPKLLWQLNTSNRD
jgi:hypothetical protein